MIKGKITTFLGSDLIDPDLLIILIAYLFLIYGPISAGVFAFGQGLLVDLFSGGLPGLFAVVYLSVFGGIYFGCRFLNLEDLKGQVALVSLAFLLKKTVVVSMIGIFSLEVVLSRSFLLISAASAVGTGLITPALFPVLKHLRAVFIGEVQGH